MVDRDLLRRKLAELSEYVTQVSEYRDLTVGRYRAEWKTGFRNVVVHEYTRIDVEVVIRILRERLEDFRRFETEALGWL